jgi:hypothetical protein
MAIAIARRAPGVRVARRYRFPAPTVFNPPPDQSASPKARNHSVDRAYPVDADTSTVRCAGCRPRTRSESERDWLPVDLRRRSDAVAAKPVPDPSSVTARALCDRVRGRGAGEQEGDHMAVARQRGGFRRATSRRFPQCHTRVVSRSSRAVGTGRELSRYRGTRTGTNRRWDRREHRRARPLGPIRSMASTPITRVPVARSVRNVGGDPRQSARMFPYEPVPAVGMAWKVGLEIESTTTLETRGRPHLDGRPLPSGRSPAGRRQGSSRTGRR